MQVHRDLDNLPLFRNAVVTIGTFDGVHEGHRQLILKLKEEADAVKGETVLVTFHPHPRKVVSSSILGIRLLTTLEERIELLDWLGIDHLVVVPFTDAFANQLPEDYVSDFLVKKFKPHTIIIGYDHRFGRDRQGDYRLLEKMAPQHGYIIKEIPKHIIDEISISSTNIREAVLHGDLTTANKLLGYEFFFEGTVVDGDKLGRKLGYPTANIHLNDPEKLIPGDGIYAVYVTVDNGKNPTEIKMKGMMSIGFRPTLDGRKRVVEVNIFDFDRVIYGRNIRIHAIKYLRPEEKFGSVEELVEQIGKDKVRSMEVL